jgi:tRNA (adenine37-N6)-methyltransferase
MKLQVKPPIYDKLLGIFAVRGPIRPNPIGLTVVKLNSIEENIMHIENVDILDGTPLLDIKPFIPEFDAPNNTKIGWMQNKQKEISNVRIEQQRTK